MKESEYGGSDLGIEDPRHMKTADEKLRGLAATDPSDPNSGSDIVGDIGKA